MTPARTNYHAVRYVTLSSCLVTIKDKQSTTTDMEPHAWR